MIQGHGDDSYRYKETIRANFSSNVRYGELDPELQSYLQERIAEVTHYPDPGGERIQQLAADVWGLNPGQVLVTNGAVEAIYLVAQAARRLVSGIRGELESATIFTPAFSEYEDACRLQGMNIRHWPWDNLLSNSNFEPRLVFIGNPNNPTGRVLAEGVLQKLFVDNPHAFFIIDESYIEFTNATKSLLPELDLYPNCILLRSLTKNCRIPGLRLGFVMGSCEALQALRKYKIPWSVNRLAIEAGLFILKDPSRFIISPDPLLAATAEWRRQLQEATGWIIHPSDTHYFLVEICSQRRASHANPADLPFAAGAPPFATGSPLLAAGSPPLANDAPPFTAAALKEYLIRQHSLLIRDAANFRGLGPWHFRVACQSPDHNQLLTDALRKCIHTGI